MASPRLVWLNSRILEWDIQFDCLTGLTRREFGSLLLGLAMTTLYRQ
jgi:hypothetical protein